MKQFKRLAALLAVLLPILLPQAASSQALMRHSAGSVLAVSPAPELDLSIRHYSRVVTANGVVRESRSEETMLRRHNHVWLVRVLPDTFAGRNLQQHAGRNVPLKTVTMGLPQPAIEHPLAANTMPRHVTLEAGRLKLELVDTKRQEIIVVAPEKYADIRFDGSWSNAYYLLDSRMIAALFLSKQSASGTHWRSQEKDGYFQRVLWNEEKMIPLVIETGSRDGKFFRRTEVQVRKGLTRDLPWKKLQAYVRKEYVQTFD